MSIKTTHVGSLPRTQEVVDMIFARENGESYDQTEFDAVDRYTGFSGDSPRNAPGDLKLFPSFLKRLADAGGTPQYARPMCTGEVKSKGQDELLADIANLKAGMAAHGVEEGFMNAASPGVISLFLQNDFYPTREAYLAALADAMAEEYRTIVDAGLYLQLDCPDLALSRHMLFGDLSDAEFLSIAGIHVEALNHALSGIDPSRVRVHICCEWTVFRDRVSEIPEDKVLVPGVVDSTTNFVEHPEVVAQRLERFLPFMGAERVIAGSDCGFGTFAGFGAVDPDIAYAKLGSLVEGAQLAAARI